MQQSGVVVLIPLESGGQPAREESGFGDVCKEDGEPSCRPKEPPGKKAACPGLRSKS